MKALILAGLLSVLLCFSGCSTELHQKMLIKGFGVDKEGEEYVLTVRYAALNESDKETQTTVRGESIYEALNSLSLTTGKKQMYSSAGFVIYGKKTAQEGLDKALDFFVRYFKSGPTISLYVAKDKASDILNTEKDEKLIPSDTIKSFTENKENNGKTTSATALSFVSDMEREGGGGVVPIIEKEKDELKCTRGAVFSGYKMLGELSESASYGYLAGKGMLKNSSFVVENKKGDKITAQVTDTSSKIKYNMDGGAPAFTVFVEAKAVLSSAPLSGRLPDFSEIEELISEQIRADWQESIKISKKTKADIQSLGYMMYIKETDYWRQHRDDWSRILPGLEVNLDITTKLISIGEEDRPKDNFS